MQQMGRPAQNIKGENMVLRGPDQESGSTSAHGIYYNSECDASKKQGREAGVWAQKKRR
jgi:hypothetical protein